MQVNSFTPIPVHNVIKVSHCRQGVKCFHKRNVLYIIKLMTIIIQGDKKVRNCMSDQLDFISHLGGDGGDRHCGSGLQSRRLATGRWANHGPSRSHCRLHHCRHAHYLLDWTYPCPGGRTCTHIRTNTVTDNVCSIKHRLIIKTIFNIKVTSTTKLQKASI